MNTVYEKKYAHSKYVYVLTYVLYTLISIAINCAKVPIVNVAYSMFILCALSNVLFEAHGKSVIINSGIVIIYLALTDLLVTAVFSSMISSSTYSALQEPNLYLISGIANGLVMLCTNNLLIQFVLRCQISKISKALHIYMIFLLLFEMWVLCYLIARDSDIEHNIPLILVSVGFIVVVCK